MAILAKHPINYGYLRQVSREGHQVRFCGENFPTISFDNAPSSAGLYYLRNLR